MNLKDIKNKKIDCHTHIIRKEFADEYFSKTTGYALVMQMPSSIMQNDDCIQTVQNDDRLFLNAYIDIKNPIQPQLDKIEKNLDNWKVVGLKIYLTYQKGKANDEKLFPIYDFAQRHGLSVTYHTGYGSLVLPSDNDVEGSNAKYVEEVAKKYPSVNFIVAHMDDPRYDECIKIVCANENMFTDFSGAYETGTKEGNDIEGAVKVFKKAIKSVEGSENSILYGTDFCPSLNMPQVEEYDYTISKIFDEKDYEKIYYRNCLKAFPRLKKFLEKLQRNKNE